MHIYLIIKANLVLYRCEADPTATGFTLALITSMYRPSGLAHNRSLYTARRALRVA